MNTEEPMETTLPMNFDLLSPSNNHNNLTEDSDGERVLFEESQEWCHISYYEMANRVGEQYRGTQSQVIIDGYTNPSNAERFCLGGLTNVQRTLEIDRARRYIGRGVKLFHIRGNVFAECLSDNPVFVQSPITNRRFGWHPATVCKIPPSKNFEF
jgi:MAD (mothers against decapentaplegic) family protein 2/3